MEIMGDAPRRTQGCRRLGSACAVSAFAGLSVRDVRCKSRRPLRYKSTKKGRIAGRLCTSWDGVGSRVTATRGQGAPSPNVPRIVTARRNTKVYRPSPAPQHSKHVEVDTVNSIRSTRCRPRRLFLQRGIYIAIPAQPTTQSTSFLPDSVPRLWISSSALSPTLALAHAMCNHACDSPSGWARMYSTACLTVISSVLPNPPTSRPDTYRCG